MLKYDLASGFKLVEDKDIIDINWGLVSSSSDNLVWSCNINTRTDPSKIIFSFDGSNYTYYGPGVAQNGPNASYAIDANNIFIGYYSGVVWQYDSGDWIKHAICREDEAGYSVKEIWASSKDNVFIAGSDDIFDEQNFAYHYDGKCWTRWFKGDGSRNISHIWGTPDGSAVLALDDEGDLYRLYVEK